MLLLLTPLCGEVCHAQSCPALAHEPKMSGCHESAGVGLAASRSSVLDSARTCNLEQLPAVLPADFRAPSLRSAPFVKSSSLESPAVLASAQLLRSRLAMRTAADGNTRSHGLRPDADCSSPLVLRI